MVNHEMCAKKSEFNKNTLYSNLFLKTLYEENVIEKLNTQIEAYKLSNNTEPIISVINDAYSKIIQEIENSFISTEEFRCCRDISYYVDLLNSIVKLTNIFSKDHLDNLTDIIEEKWKKVPKVCAIEICKGETDLDSMRKRCILKHLHDLELDKNFIKVNPNEYKTFLKEKWDTILKYTKPELGGLYIKIESDSVAIIEEYSNFLNSYDYICEVDLDKLNPDDITISTDMNNLINNISLDKILSNNINKACYNENYIEMLKIKTSSVQRINNLLSIGIALLGFSLIFIFLYRFSPLGSILRRYKKNKNEVDENTNEEFPELYENTENIGRYISYTSESH
ncbi:PIR Superfamily Protein [Plasmodium ovale wallikeri]|uniref:PIR protein n=2 Tax=Plasmodium ovale TaxID=36330 RepID=A0A1C3KJ61_PLAOA|nr:PIR Superfamily Protein [Plasmodium ovale wallikeri]SBT73873.1 PIR protein [Plasmodium ovale]